MSATPADRVFRELQALARADYGGNSGALLAVCAVEGFLRRLSISEGAEYHGVRVKLVAYLSMTVLRCGSPKEKPEMILAERSRR